jgi:hypothetical protein
MKKHLIILAFLCFSAAGNMAFSQVHVNVNIGLQPVWGPVGYDHVEYYYLPDADAYYYVPEHRFYYNEGGAWVSGAYLPGRYHDLDLYHVHKVVINEPQPWLRHNEYHERYHSYAGRRDQEVIRESHDQRYWEIKEHPEHGKWKGGDHGDHGNHGDHGDHGHGGHDEGEHGHH